MTGNSVGSARRIGIVDHERNGEVARGRVSVGYRVDITRVRRTIAKVPVELVGRNTTRNGCCKRHRASLTTRSWRRKDSYHCGKQVNYNTHCRSDTTVGSYHQEDGRVTPGRK